MGHTFHHYHIAPFHFSRLSFSLPLPQYARRFFTFAFYRTLDIGVLPIYSGFTTFHFYRLITLLSIFSEFRFHHYIPGILEANTAVSRLQLHIGYQVLGFFAFIHAVLKRCLTASMSTQYRVRSYFQVLTIHHFTSANMVKKVVNMLSSLACREVNHAPASRSMPYTKIFQVHLVMLIKSLAISNSRVTPRMLAPSLIISVGEVARHFHYSVTYDTSPRSDLPPLYQ